MPKSKRDLLADAHAEIRNLKNRVAAMDVEREAWTAPLRAEVESLRDRCDWLSNRSVELDVLRATIRDRLSDVELYALAAAVYTEAGEQTAARTRLVAELTLRGVLTGKSS